MSQQSLRQQFVKLTEVRDWIRLCLCQEGDKPTRDALFLVNLAIGVALLHLEKVSYRTQTDEVTERMYHSEKK